MVIDTYFNDIYTYDSILSTLKMEFISQGTQDILYFHECEACQGKTFHDTLNFLIIKFYFVFQILDSAACVTWFDVAIISYSFSHCENKSHLYSMHVNVMNDWV